VIILRNSIHLMCVVLIVGNVSPLKSHLKMHLAEVEYYTFSCLNILFGQLTALSDTEY